MIECWRTIHEEKQRGETRGGKECLLLRDGKMVLTTFSFSVHDIYVREKETKCRRVNILKACSC